MTENKFSKYLVYAVGEIVLVVVGILIALQVNNWNVKQKDEAKTVNYLKNLIGALDNDIATFHHSISFNKTRLKGIFYLLEQSGLNTHTFTELDWMDNFEEDKANNLWQGAFPDTLNQQFTILAFSLIGRGFGGISLDKTVINELYSTGSFSNIEDDKLKSQIGNYYSFAAKRLEGYAIEEHEEWANETTRFLRDQCGIFSLDVSDMENPIERLKGRKDVEHHLRYLALEVNYHCIWALNAKEQALDLQSLIEKKMQLE